MKHFDLFSGYGGFTLALEKIYETNITLSRNRSTRPEHGGSSQSLLQGGSMPTTQEPPFATIGFSEIDKYASAVLKYHWPNTKNYGDITKINWSEVPDFDLLTGGSPCQDLSIAGKRAGLEGARSGLFYEYMRAVKEKRPKYFIWENVKGALSSNKGFDFGSVLNEMAEAGYSLWWQVLNAKDFGVPQNRERIFVVGFRDGSPREIFFERESNGENNLQYIGSTKDIDRVGDGKNLSRNAREGYRIYKESGISPALRSQLGGDSKGSAIVQLNNPTHSNNRLYSEEGISPALNTAQGGNRQPKIPTNSRIRRLTPTECERLMGLPDGWTSKGIIDGKEVEISDSQRYKLCGNGVVVNVVEEIIKELIIGS